MSRPLRRPAAVLTAALAVAFLPLLPATPAAAQAGDYDINLALVDSDFDGGHGVYANGPALVAELPTRDVSEMSASADGSRFVTIEDTMTPAGDPLREQVVVHDVGGQQVRVVDDLDLGGDAFDGSPTMSPDGSTVIWSQIAFTDTQVTYTLRKAAASSGAATQLATGFVTAQYLTADTVLTRSTAAGAEGEYRVLRLSTGVTSAIGGAGIPAAAFDVAPSEDGTKLVWSLDTTPTSDTYDGPITSDVQTAPFDATALTTGAATTLTTGLENDSPAFSHNGQDVLFVRWDGDNGSGDVWSVPMDGSAAAYATRVTTDDEVAVEAGARNDVVPADLTSQPFTLSGTTATLRWTPPADADLSGVIVTRSLNGTAQKQFYVAAPATSVVDTGLVLGSTYSYTLVAVDRSGNGHGGPASGRSLTAVAPAVSFADPTSATTTRAPFVVRFAAVAPAGVTFTVDYSTNGGGFRSWVAGKTGAARTFGAASAGAAATVSTPGTTYRFRVSAADAYGNTTAQVLSGKSVVPFDQTRATLSGGTNVARGDSWFGTLRTLSAPAHYARIAVTGDRFQVLGERCPSCGVVDIYDGATRIASVDTRASARQPRAVLYTRLWSTVGNHTITLKPRGTAGRPSVVLDGFAVRR